MGTTIFIYVVLLLIFIAISGLIFRHTLKFSYLSPKFRYIVVLFAFISLALIILSVYLLSQVDNSSNSTPINNTPSTSGELNF